MKTYYIPGETMAAIKEREFTVYNFTSKGRFYPCYSKLMQYLLSDSPVLINNETNQPESVERGEVLDIYAVAYDKGRDIFKNDIKPDASIDFLIEQYNEHYNGWKATSEALSLLLTQSQVEKMGQAAGIRYEFEIYKQKKRDEFEAIEHKENPKRLIVKGFKDNTAERLKKIYSYLHNKKHIDCNEDVWLYWFSQKELSPVPERIQWKGADTLLTVIIKTMCNNGGQKHIESAFIYKDKYQKQNKMFQSEVSKINQYMGGDIKKFD